jgi:uncharacterized membrane protein
MIKESIRYGWQKFKENKKVAILATVVVLILGIISGIGDEKGPFGENALTITIGIIASIILLIARIGHTKIFLRMTDGEKPELSGLFKEYRLFWKYLGVTILFPLTVFAGLILLIIPGIYWAVRFAFSPLIVVDTGAGPIRAMKESWAITKGKFWRLFWFCIVIILINIAGFLLIGVGLLVTIPISTFASIQVYRKLSQQKAAIAVA